MGGGREHRYEPSITKNDLAHIVNDKTGLEIKVREVRVKLVCITRQIDPTRFSDLAHTLVFGAIHFDAGLSAPLGNTLAHGEAGQEVLGKHD